MKKRIILIATVVAGIFVIILSGVHWLGGDGNRPSRATAWAGDFESSPDFKKLDLRAQQAWREAMKTGDKKRELKCLIKVKERMTQRQKSQLAGAGFQPVSIIQTIVTGKVLAGKVPQVAGLDFVAAMELAVPLSIKKDPGYRKYGTSRVKPKVTTEAKPQAKQNEQVQPAEETSIERLENRGKGFSDSKDVPIYQTKEEEEVISPNRPPTSNEIPGEGPAVAPVDQGDVVVMPEETVTEPVIEKPKSESQVPSVDPTVQTQVEIPGAKKQEERPIYAPAK